MTEERKPREWRIVYRMRGKLITMGDPQDYHTPYLPPESITRARGIQITDKGRAYVAEMRARRVGCPEVNIDGTRCQLPAGHDMGHYADMGNVVVGWPNRTKGKVP